MPIITDTTTTVTVPVLMPVALRELLEREKKYELEGLDETITRLVDEAVSRRAIDERKFEPVRNMLNAVAIPRKCGACGRAVYFLRNRLGHNTPYTATGVNHLDLCPAAAKYRGG